MYVDALLALAGSISGNTITPAAVFGNGTTVVSGSFTGGNVVDVASPGNPSGNVRDLGEGLPLYLRVQVPTAFTGGTSATFNIVSATDTAITAGVTVIGTTGAIPVASLTAGSRFVAEVNPQLALKGQRYLGLQVINVGNNTTGAIYADLGDAIQDGQKFYPSGFAIL
jgi:predicted RecA/RadA family phage recombinase